MYNEFLKIGKKFGLKCAICKEPMNLKTKSFGWTIHHCEYPAGELTYRHFNPEKPEFLWKDMEKKIEGIHLRSLYRLELFRQIRRHPKRFFELTCSPHHQAIEKLDQFNPVKVRELIKIWKKTRTKWKVK